MGKFVARLLADTEGAETAEWVVIVALVVTVAVTIYTGGLHDALSGMIRAALGQFADT